MIQILTHQLLVPDAFCDKPSDSEKETQLANMPDDYLWVWEAAEVDGEQVETIVLKSCPPGHRLVNSSGSGFNPALQKCLPCGRGRYILDMYALCEECPKGADCRDGDMFEPFAPGSVWEEIELSAAGSLASVAEYRRVKRVLECPPGYAILYDEALPVNDDCQPCERGTYRLEPCWRNSSVPHCILCDPRATCPGRDVVEAVAGYWRVQLLRWGTTHEYLPEASLACAGRAGQACLFPREGLYWLDGWQERSMTCMPLPGGGDELFCARPILVERDASSRRQLQKALNSNASNSSTAKAMVVKCPIGACDNNNTCRQNRTGPVCGFCKPGYSMNANGCSAKPCPSGEELQTVRWLAGAIFFTLFFAAWVALSLKPVLPELEWLMARLLQGIVSMLSHLVCFYDANGDVGGGVLGILKFFKWFLKSIGGFNTWWRQQQMPQFLKIIITYLQVLGGFTVLSIEWPDFVIQAMSTLKNFAQMNPITLQGLSCVVYGVDFYQQLFFYTMGLIGLIVLFLLPVPFAYLRGFRNHDTHNVRWRQTLDKFWSNLSFSLFIFYPAVCMASLRPFNCDANLGLLRDDYTLPCEPIHAYTSIYAAVFVVLYPIGIPVFLNLACRSMHITAIVREKMNVAKVEAMLALFLRRSCSAQTHRVARLVGNTDNDTEEFNRQSELEFKKLLQLQGDKSLEVLVVERLRSVQTSHGFEGVTLKDLCSFFEQFDADGDGNVDLDEFRLMISTSREATSLFTGSEELAHLSNAQLNALLLYDDWPEKHEGPGDLDEGEGLGGLFKHISKEHKTPNVINEGEEESEDHVERRHALERGGFREEFPSLLELDELVAELQGLDKTGQLWWYPEWETDKTEGERIFLDTPDELPSWINRMRIKQLNESEKRVMAVGLAESLVSNAIIAVPPQTWKIDFADAQDTSKEASYESIDQSMLQRVCLLVTHIHTHAHTHTKAGNTGRAALLSIGVRYVSANGQCGCFWLSLMTLKMTPWVVPNRSTVSFSWHIVWISGTGRLLRCVSMVGHASM
jgi:Ca2+-binding EF-hand superfamily protein